MRTTITEGALSGINAAFRPQLPQLMLAAVVEVLMSSNGFVINSAIDGSIQMKPSAQFPSQGRWKGCSTPHSFGESASRSYLMGNPELKLALNEAAQVLFACSLTCRKQKDIVVKNMDLGGSHGGSVRFVNWWSSDAK